MPSPRDERLEDFRSLRERVRRQPENFGAFAGELHTFLHDLYAAAARADGNAAGFAKALDELCAASGLKAWQDVLSPDERRRFFKDDRDPLARRVVAFWSKLDGPLQL